MKKKTLIIIILIAAVLACAIGAWAYANRSSGEPEETSEFTNDSEDLTESDDWMLEDQEGTGIFFEEEADGAVIEKVARDSSDFVGSWEATSDFAQSMYGSVEVNVLKDGTWDARITGEPIGGTWENKGDYLHMNDTKAELFSFDLAFDKQGNLIMIDSDSDDPINTVLTRKE